MALPGFIGGLTSLAFLLLVFRKQLAKPMKNEIEPLQPEKSKVRIFKETSFRFLPIKQSTGRKQKNGC